MQQPKIAVSVLLHGVVELQNPIPEIAHMTAEPCVHKPGRALTATHPRDPSTTAVRTLFIYPAEFSHPIELVIWRTCAIP